MNNKTIPEIVETIIRSRKTEKVVCDIESYRPVPADIAAHNREIVLRAIKTAGWAPLHYQRIEGGIAEPWRAHVLWQDEAKKAAFFLRNELKTTTNELRLTAACNALVIVTWLPEFYNPVAQRTSELPRMLQISHDEDHLAATGAMVQNLLLILTAHGMRNCWSSGGKFRGQEMFNYLGIPSNERLIATVFIEYPEMRDESKECQAGSLRNSRCENWIREVSI